MWILMRLRPLHGNGNNRMDLFAVEISVARERRWSMGNSLTMLSAERIHDLSQALCKRAWENSLNLEVDSPFAILAKENHIMWSGGMPDECTVIAMHIVARSAEDLMGKTKFWNMFEHTLPQQQ
jgi:hypothetical protein